MRRICLLPKLALPALLSLVAMMTVALPAYPATFAHLAVGGGYEAVLQLTNKTTSTWTGRLRIRRGNNALWSTPLTANGTAFPASGDQAITLAPRATLKLTLRGDATVQTGYFEITGTGGSITTNVATAYFYNFYSDGVLRDTTGSPESNDASRFVFAVERTPTTDTGFAWAPYTTIVTPPSFPITMSLFDANGGLFQTRTVTFEGHLARFFTEVFTDVPANFAGHVVVEMTPPNLVYMTVLRIELTPTGFQLTSTPPDMLAPIGPQ